MNDITWYHGSPLRLTVLREGSTITQNHHLAEVFSHKPAIVSIEDDGTLRHNGTLPGYQYRVVGVEPDDVYPHPRSTMPPNLEWLTRRELHLALIGPTVIRAEEFLTEDDIAALRRAMNR